MIRDHWWVPARAGHEEAAHSRERWYRPIAFGVTVVILAVAAIVLWLAYSKAAGLGRVGADLTLYVEATRGWMGGASFYPAHQITGPYTITDGDILYPPTTIPLFVAFLVLPAVLFWLVPAVVVIAVVIRHNPSAWTWPLMALCLAYPPTMVKIVHANPFMWAAMFVALGTVYGWPAIFALLKPSLAPFALIGIRHKAWWALAGLGLLLTLVFAPMWPDYLRALTNSRNADGLLYSLSDFPLLLIPVVAWLSSRLDPERVRHIRRIRAVQPDDTPDVPTGTPDRGGIEVVV